MPSQSLVLLALLTKSLTLATVIPCSCETQPESLGENQALGLNFYMGNDGIACTDLYEQVVFNREEVFGLNYCFSTTVPATCIIRRLEGAHRGQIAQPDPDGWDLGFDATPYDCKVTGYALDGCPTGTGIPAQYNVTAQQWSWGNGTNTGGDGPGTVQSFQMECSKTLLPPGPQPQPGSWNIPFVPMPSGNPPSPASMGTSIYPQLFGRRVA